MVNIYPLINTVVILTVLSIITLLIYIIGIIISKNERYKFYRNLNTTPYPKALIGIYVIYFIVVAYSIVIAIIDIFDDLNLCLCIIIFLVHPVITVMIFNHIAKIVMIRKNRRKLKKNL